VGCCGFYFSLTYPHHLADIPSIHQSRNPVRPSHIYIQCGNCVEPIWTISPSYMMNIWVWLSLNFMLPSMFPNDPNLMWLKQLTRINHPPNHHKCGIKYKPFPNGWFMALFYPHYSFSALNHPEVLRCKPEIARWARWCWHKRFASQNEARCLLLQSLMPD
jgi:hypothetical protein